METFFNIFFLIFILFFFYINGVFFQTCFIKGNDNIKNNYFYLLPIFGLSFFCIVITILYNFVNLTILEINFTFLIFYLTFFFKIRKNFVEHLINFFNILKLIFPVILFYCFIILFRDENFYVFRGNYWDQFTMISMGIIFENNQYKNISDLLIRENFVLENFENFYNNLRNNIFSKDHYYFSFQNLFTRQFNSLLLAFFFKLKFIDLFIINLCLKMFFISNIILSTKLLFSIFNYKIKNSTFYAFIFTFSFWTLYIFEIDALAQLCSFSILILLLALSKKIIFDNNFSKSNYFITLILYSSLFLIYPSLFVIFNFFLLIYLLFNIQFCKKNYFKILSFLLFFILISSPRIIDHFNLLTMFASGSPDYWYYFGGFVLGKESIITNFEVVNYLKDNINQNNDILSKIRTIVDINYSNGFNLIFYNILLSLFGFYHLAPEGLRFNLETISLLFLSLFIYLIIFKNIFLNFKFLIKNIKKNKFQIATILIIFFLFIILFLSQKPYALLKLYFFVSPILFLVLFTNFQKELNLSLFVLLILLTTMPIYKYKDNNYGIGTHDSLPSILDVNKKKNTNWKLTVNSSNLKKCKNGIKILTNDIIERGFLSLKLDYLKIKELKNKKSNCSIKKIGKNFTIIYE